MDELLRRAHGVFDLRKHRGGDVEDEDGRERVVHGLERLDALRPPVVEDREVLLSQHVVPSDRSRSGEPDGQRRGAVREALAPRVDARRRDFPPLAHERDGDCVPPHGLPGRPEGFPRRAGHCADFLLPSTKKSSLSPGRALRSNT